MDNQELKRYALKLRRGILRATHAAASGHPGGSLSATEVFTLLYFEELHVDPKNPEDPKRDRFVLSKGHCAPGLYAALAARGFFPEEDLLTLRHIGSYLQGHPDMKRKFTASPIAPIRCSATVRLKRERSGRQPCSRAFGSSTTSW